MMHNLLLEEGDIVQLKSLSLPVATFSKFQPQNPDFLDITNPKAVLENALRNFACLTSGDLIAIKYNSKIYELCVLETKPGNAVSIIECDMNVSGITRIQLIYTNEVPNELLLRSNLLRPSVIRNHKDPNPSLRATRTNRWPFTMHKALFHLPERVIDWMARRRNTTRWRHSSNRGYKF